MRIAILTQSYPPMISGAAIFAERLAGGMSARGRDVLVVAASDRPCPYRQNQPNLRITRCRSFRNPLRAAQRFALWPHRQISACLAEFSPDVIHIHDPFQFAWSSLAFSRARKVPVVYTIHQLPWFVSAYIPAWKSAQKAVENGLWRYARWVLRQCTAAVIATQTIAEVMYSHTGIYPQVISCGVDLSAFSPQRPIQADELRTKLGIPENAPIILHVGRLDADKQTAKVVQAAAVAMQQTPAHLLAVGDGTERAELERLCARLGINGRSHFPGFISFQEDLAALYQISTVFVTASEIETQGLVLLEAAACGLPIVAVRSTCLHEIVHEGENGYLVTPGDGAGLAERLTWLVQNPADASRMGRTGREMVKAHAVESTIDAYEEVYRSAINSPRRLGALSASEAGAPGRAAPSNGCG